VNLPIPLSSPILPLHIQILLHLHNSSNRLPGDWNARTCEEHDYILTNFDTFSDFLNVDNDGVQMLEELNVEILRKSMDNRKNNFGNRLLELCRCCEYRKTTY
jgi:hypothetical protein